jgi:UDP-glucose 4-epimerase
MPKVIVSGGCGYIGSHSAVDLLANGFDVISIDNFIRSQPKILKHIEDVSGKTYINYCTDLCDKKQLAEVFSAHADAVGVIHFAALKSVPESVKKPLDYYSNNIGGLCNLLEMMSEFKIPNIIFSSSCSVYGNVQSLPVSEGSLMGRAESPYAATKQMGERIIEDFIKSEKDKNAVLLRYFNPGGAHPSGLLGEMPQNNISNLIPILMNSVSGSNTDFYVHGNDYPTRDGTCIRDYIHIMDLADAHTRSLRFLLEAKNSNVCEVFNVGIGDGVTVMEAIKATELATGLKVPYKIGPRRDGDVVAIYADYTKAAHLLGWQPKYDINDIMRSAWKWEQYLMAESEG